MKSVVADYRYRVLCLRIEPVHAGGSVIRLTDHPRDLTMSNGQTYLTRSGYEFTGYSSSSGMQASMVDLEGIAGISGVGRDQLMSGAYDGARAYLFATTWRTPTEDQEPMLASILGKVTLLDERYRVEEMALVDALGQTVGDTYTPGCPKRFGGQEFAGCKVALGPITVTGALTHKTSNIVFRDSGRTEAADWFAAGTIRFTSGANAGLPPKEVKRFEADGTVEIFEPFHYAVEIGDEYEMVPGCRKRLQDCRDKWNNVANFGGFSFVPVGSRYQEVGTK